MVRHFQRLLLLALLVIFASECAAPPYLHHRRKAFRGGGSDPDFSSVSLLVSFNGTDGSSTFTDRSGNAHSITAVNTAQVDTAVVKLGSGSLYEPSTSDYLSISGHSSFALDADFTIEAFVYFNTAPNGTPILDIGGYSSGLSLRANQESGSNLSLYFRGSHLQKTKTWSTGVWYHIAITRSGSTITFYVDGTSLGTSTSSSTFSSSTPAVRIGGLLEGGGTVWNHQIDEMRVTKGVARTITVPTEEYPGQ